MQIPAAMFIESAMDMIKARKPEELLDELLELRVANGERVELPNLPDPLNSKYEETWKQYMIADEEEMAFFKGYLLGLEVARVILMTTPAAIKAGVAL